MCMVLMVAKWDDVKDNVELKSPLWMQFGNKIEVVSHDVNKITVRYLWNKVSERCLFNLLLLVGDRVRGMSLTTMMERGIRPEDVL